MLSSKKVENLRNILSQKSLDAYIVPLTDEFQSEYIAPYAQRLEWLTDFSGSAGIAIIAKDKAAIFVDGRYITQAYSQVDKECFEIHLISEKNHYEWLEENLNIGSNLGVDPFLFSYDSVKKYEEIIAKKKSKLVVENHNLVDQIWQDKPSVELNSIYILENELCGQSSEDKLSDLKEWCERHHVDGVFLSRLDSIAWLLNLRGSDIPYNPLFFSYLYFSLTHGIFLYLPKDRNLANIESYLTNLEIKVQTIEDLSIHINSLDVHSIGLEEVSVPFKIWDIFSEHGVQIHSIKDPVFLRKSKKNTIEIEGMKKAHLRDGLAVTKFLAWLDSQKNPNDLTEISVSDKLESYRKQNNHFMGLSFPTISGMGENGAVIHYKASKVTNKTFENNNLYLVDSGAQYIDGTTDITRTVAIGKPSDDQIKHYTLVLKGHVQLSDAIFPAGTSGSQLDILARQALWKEGLDYQHGTGHGVGFHLCVHEGPQNISKYGTAPLEKGMVLSNEPGYYLPGQYGIRIENLIFVEDSQKKYKEKGFYYFETLTFVPYDRRLIKKDLLSDDEVKWINDYHSHVFSLYHDKLTESEYDWLKQATEPL